VISAVFPKFAVALTLEIVSALTGATNSSGAATNEQMQAIFNRTIRKSPQKM
jgi:hypothetical protein